MSTTLFFLVPIGMLAVVWSVCFVGCVFQTGGLEPPYSNAILEESSLVAYWPLSDFTATCRVNMPFRMRTTSVESRPLSLSD